MGHHLIVADFFPFFELLYG